MNISKKLKGLLAASVAAVGLTAFAEPMVTVDKVETYQPWSKIGVSYTLGGTDAAVKSLLGEEWRVPSKAEFEKLNNSSYCTRTWDAVRKGYTFTGVTEGYTDKSIFLPAAGILSGSVRGNAGVIGSYWASGTGGYRPWRLQFDESSNLRVRDEGATTMSVRAVR